MQFEDHHETFEFPIHENSDQQSTGLVDEVDDVKLIVENKCAMENLLLLCKII